MGMQLQYGNKFYIRSLSPPSGEAVLQAKLMSVGCLLGLASLFAYNLTTPNSHRAKLGDGGEVARARVRACALGLSTGFPLTVGILSGY